MTSQILPTCDQCHGTKREPCLHCDMAGRGERYCTYEHTTCPNCNGAGVVAEGYPVSVEVDAHKVEEALALMSMNKHLKDGMWAHRDNEQAMSGRSLIRVYDRITEIVLHDILRNEMQIQHDPLTPDENWADFDCEQFDRDCDMEDPFRDFDQPTAWSKYDITLSAWVKKIHVHWSTNDDQDQGYPSAHASGDYFFDTLEQALEFTGHTRNGVWCRVEVTLNGVLV